MGKISTHNYTPLFTLFIYLLLFNSTGITVLNAQSDMSTHRILMENQDVFESYQSKYDIIADNFSSAEIEVIAQLLRRDLYPDEQQKELFERFSFTMLPENPTIEINKAGLQSILLSENFVDETFPPDQWSSIKNSDMNLGWQRASFEFDYVSGEASAYHNVEFNENSWLITPQLAIPEDAMLQFSELSQGMPFYGYSALYISKGSNDPESGDFEFVMEFDDSQENTWRLITVALEEYENEDIYIAFNYSGDYAHLWYIDDVNVYVPSPEPFPVRLTGPDDEADNVAISPTLTWQSSFGTVPDFYRVYLSTDQTNYTSIGTTTDQELNTGILQPLTTYYWYVIAYTNTGFESDPSEIRSFTTEPIVSEFPFIETFDDDSETRSQWTQEFLTGWEIPWTFGAGSSQGNIEDAYIGELNARFSRQSTFSRQRTRLITPTFITDGLENPSLWFYYAMDMFNPNNTVNELSVEYRVPGGDWIELFSNNTHTTDWTHEVLELPDVPAIQLAFYGNHQDYDDIVVDRVWVGDFSDLSDVPPVTMLSPTDNSSVSESPLLDWDAPEAGDYSLEGYRVYMDDSFPPETLVYEGNDTFYQTSGIEEGKTYYWKVVPYNSLGISTPDSSIETWSFVYPQTFDNLSEDFESGQLPDWQRGAWALIDFDDAISGDRVLRLSVSRLLLDSELHDPIEGIMYASVRTPALDVRTSSTFSFYARGYEENTNVSSSKYIQVLYSEDDETWTPLSELISVSSEWQQYDFSIDEIPDGDYYFAIGAYRSGGHLGTHQVLIDDVEGPQISPKLPAKMSSDNLPMFGNNIPIDGVVSADVESVSFTAYDLDISNTMTRNRRKGSQPKAYKLFLDTNPNPETLVFAGEMTTTQHTQSETVDLDLEHDTIYYYKIVSVNNAGENESEIRTFRTVPENVIIDTFPYYQTFAFDVDDNDRHLYYTQGYTAHSLGSWSPITSNSGSDDRNMNPRSPGTSWISLDRPPGSVDPWFSLPAIDVPADLINDSDFIFSFWQRTFASQNGGSPHTIRYKILLSTDGQNFDTTLEENDSFSSETWEQVSIPLDDYAGQRIYLKFEFTGGTGHISGARPVWHIDDIHLGITTAGPVGVEEPDGTPASAGFYIVGNPVINNSVGDILESVWTQGFPGSDSPSNGEPNVHLLEEPSNSYTPVPNASYIPDAGTGFVTYIFEDDNFDGTPEGFPKTLEFQGPTHTEDVVVPLSLESEGWNMLGNPYKGSLRLNAFTLDDFDGTDGFAYRYSNANDEWYAYDLFNNTGVYFSNIVEQFEGFVVKSLQPNTNFTFRMEMLEEELPAWYGPIGCINDCTITWGEVEPEEPKELPAVQFKLESDEHRGRTYILFSNELNQFRSGAEYLQPLTDQMTSIFSISDGSPLVMRYVDSQLGGEISIPIGFFTTADSDLNLTWKFTEDILEDWTFHLLDNATGEMIDLRTEELYSFDFTSLMTTNISLDSLRKDSTKMVYLDESSRVSDASRTPLTKKKYAGISGKLTQTENRSEPKKPNSLSIKDISDILSDPVMKIDGDHRFELIVSMTATDLEPENELPTVLDLHQNYPNPFNPITQIQYDLPEAADVRLDVYNVIGQQVATLVSEPQAAGRYTISFDANRLSSGVYLYRLRVGNEVLTRKMTLVK